MTVAQSGRRSLAAIAVASLFADAAVAADLNAVNHAGAIASGVVVGSAAPSLGFGAVLQTIVGLAVVIGLVFGCAWLARRFGFQHVRRGGPLKVVSSVAVGAKESATIVEIGDTWLVLGVGPGNVRLLHTLPAGSGATRAEGGAVGGRAEGRGFGPIVSDAQAPGASATGPTLSGTFGQRFRDALVQEAGKRFGRTHDR